MQVHYNLLVGRVPTPAAARLRVAGPSDGTRKTLDTMLLPAPGRAALPPRRWHTGCATAGGGGGRAAAVRREGRSTGDLLHLHVRPGRPRTTQSCPRTVDASREPYVRSRGTCTCSGARSRSWSTRARRPPGPSWTSRSGTSTTRGAHRLAKPVAVKAGDTLTVSCTHDQRSASPAAGAAEPAGALRRLGRGHDRRDVPGHRPVDRLMTQDSSPARGREQAHGRRPTVGLSPTTR